MDPTPESPEVTTSEAEAEAQAETSNVTELWLWIVVYSVCILLTLIINSFVILGLTKRRDGFKRNQLDVYLTSLIVSRMFIAVFVIPARITGLFSEAYLGSILCKLCHYVGVASAATSIFSTTAIALLKYHDNIHGHEQGIFFKEKPFAGVALVWIIGYLYAIRTPFIYDLEFVAAGDRFTGNGLFLCKLSRDCTTVGQTFVFVDLVVLFGIPGLIIVYCYYNIVKLFKNEEDIILVCQSKAIHSNLSTISGETKTIPFHKPAPRLTAAQKKVVISIVLWVAVLFFTCSSLPYGLKMYTYWSGTNPLEYSTLETALYVISYSNAWMNAVVLLYFRKDIRQTVNRVLRTDSRVHIADTTNNEDENTFGLG